MDKGMAIEWSKMPGINTGALCQLRVRETDKQVRVRAVAVEASAASHCHPIYACSSEAPRKYQASTTPVRVLWYAWLAGVAEPGADDSVLAAYTYATPGSDRERLAREACERALTRAWDSLPEEVIDR